MRTVTDKYERSERRILAFTYLMYLLFVTAPVGLAVNALKLRQYRHLPPDAARRSAESVLISAEHHLWLLRTVGVSLLLLMISIGTGYTYFGVMVLAGTVAWWVYRVGKGVLALFEHRRLPISL
jgi:uncharacterized membrane protein